MIDNRREENVTKLASTWPLRVLHSLIPALIQAFRKQQRRLGSISDYIVRKAKANVVITSDSTWHQAVANTAK